ncbi:hypothetical protein OV203_36100 [Nannocystis sp. ILAH1]|uniref:hypothetical protein n=1 Tax=Nannocystis sp. ILAH1 TaxID=2996789 RepID=UPI002270C5D4|nr:hypothetical protein [Nannocystis sp. ILAH1]MCY0992619.1 hypothetical protein [Nannocystis sp. ILAH1]
MSFRHVNLPPRHREEMPWRHVPEDSIAASKTSANRAPRGPSSVDAMTEAATTCP